MPSDLSTELMWTRLPPRMISVTRFHAFLNAAVEWEAPREPPEAL
jgi:hypothetical protein